MKKKNTKERILDKALQLFNAEGVETVTTSLVARELGMSLGNLHYHFPNRNALIEALIDRFVADERRLSQELMKVQPTGFMEHAFKVQFLLFRLMWNYRFLFSDRLVIRRRTDYLEVLFRAITDQRRIEFDATMSELRRIGLMRPDISPQLQQAYFQQLVIVNNSWIAYDSVFEYEGEPFLHFAEQAIRAWRPYLTCTDEEMAAAIGTAKEEALALIAVMEGGEA